MGGGAVKQTKDFAVTNATEPLQFLQLIENMPAENINEFLRDDNLRCSDCHSLAADWASLGFGTIICIECAGFHRSLGVHITSVRSISLDLWNVKDVLAIKFGGNSMFKQHLQAYGIEYIDKKAIYNTIEVIYYKEILLAKIESRIPLSIEEYRNINTIFGDIPSFTHNLISPESESSSKKSATGPTWIPDESVHICMICRINFSLFTRKHHCRRCGRCVCSQCAPSNNTRPIIEWGMTQPVRHCRLCFQSPVLAWNPLPIADKSIS